MLVISALRCKMLYATIANLISFAILTSSPSAVDYYVANYGSDDNPGNHISAPFKTIAKVSALVTAGDKVYIREGIYYENIAIRASGSIDKPIVFQNYEDEKVIIDGSMKIFKWNRLNENVVYTKLPFNPSHVIVNGNIFNKANSLEELKVGNFVKRDEVIYVGVGHEMSEENIAVINKSKNHQGKYQVYIEGSHIRLRGLVVRNSPSRGISAWGGDDIRIEDCVVKFTLLHGIFIEKGEGCQVNRCTVYHSNLQNWPRSTRNTWAAGIGYYAGKKGSITGNTVYLNHGEGIGTAGGWGEPGVNGLLIKNNTLYDNYSVHIYNDHGTNVVIDGNFCFVSGKQPYPDQYKSTPDGIMCAEENDFGHPGNLKSGKVINNIVVNCRSGFRFWKDRANSGLNHFIVANNTFVDSLNHGIHVDGGHHRKSIFVNNIIVQRNREYIMSFGNINDTTFSHNCWYHPKSNRISSWMGLEKDFLIDRKRVSQKKYTSTFTRADTDFFADPHFAGNTLIDPGSFKLTEKSPCIDKGFRIDIVTTDFWGNKRPNDLGYDIGASEFISSP
jgi:hypothetical protein